MDAALAIGVLSAFLVVFIFIMSLSVRQEDRVGIDKDVESIERRIITDELIPNVIDVFEHEPPAFGEEDNELVDKVSIKLEPGLKTIATAYKCQDVVRHASRFMIRCGAIGIIAEIIFIVLVANLGTGDPLIAITFGTSFFLLALCASFWYIRRRNVEHAEDMSGRV